MDLEGTVAIVTGGGTGIGRAVALDLARAGTKAVVVNYSKSREDAERTATEVGKLGSVGVALGADVASEESVRALVAETVERFGRLDVLVNNAGTTRFIPFPDLDAVTDEVWRHILGVNLTPWIQDVLLCVVIYAFFSCGSSVQGAGARLAFS